MMDCRNAQRWHDELVEGRLAETQAAELRRHLADCTDCRVARQRTTRLQQLLALKRHELPPPGYFHNFTAEFHRRLAAEEARAPWWQQLLDRIAFPAPALRYATATLAGVLLTLGAFHWTQSSHIVPSPVAQRVPAEAASLITASAAPTPGVLLVPAAVDTGTEAPGYVLDRIAITPASYEGGSVRF